MKKIFTSLSSLFFLLLLTSPCFGQNQLIDGSGETVYGWHEWQPATAPMGLYVLTSNDIASYNVATVPDGDKFAHLQVESNIQQSVLTISGSDYVVDYTRSHVQNADDKIFFVLVDDSVYVTDTILANAGVPAFASNNFTFTADDTITNIRFYVQSLAGYDTLGVLIDDISTKRDSVGAEELLLFGSFEYNTLWSPWTPTGQTTASYVRTTADSAFYGSPNIAHGGRFFEIHDESNIQQAAVTNVGDDYKLRFAYSHIPNGGDKKLMININGVDVDSIYVTNSASSSAFVYDSIAFTAAISYAQIGFYVKTVGGNADEGVLLDEIELINTSNPWGYLAAGGFGTTDGSSVLGLWLQSDDMDGDGDTTNNQAYGTPVTSWIDKSGGNFNYTASGNASPTYVIDNGTPFVNFNTGDTSFMCPVDTVSVDEGSAFFIIKGGGGGDRSCILNAGPFSLMYEQVNNSGKPGISKAGVHKKFNTPLINDSLSYISYGKKSTNSSIKLKYNDQHKARGFYNNTPMLVGSLGSADYPSDIEFAEIILFTDYLENGPRIIVENYLSTKHGVAIPDDKYSYDAEFGNELAGIGKSGGNESKKITDAQGTSILRINSASTLSNGDYLFWGHNKLEENFIDTTDVDGVIVLSRLERVWRMDESGDVGTVAIAFQINAFGQDANQMHLLIDRDGDGFTDNDIAPQSGVAAGNYVVFSNVNIQAGDRVTLGISINVPLPIELLSFDVNLMSEAVELNWTTASELNSAYFTVERSQDGKNWEEVSDVDAAGNSTLTIRYNSFDLTPHLGLSYYRLKITDMDGSYEYSDIKSVNIQSQNEYNLYPNPTKTGEFNIAGDFTKSSTILIYNMSGELLHTEDIEATEDNKIYVTPKVELKSGLYFLQLRSGKDVWYVKFIVE